MVVEVFAESSTFTFFLAASMSAILAPISITFVPFTIFASFKLWLSFNNPKTFKITIFCEL